MIGYTYVLDGENVRWKVSMYVMDLGHVRDGFLNVRDRELGTYVMESEKVR